MPWFTEPPKKALGGLKAWMQSWSLPVLSEYFYPFPAQGTYEDLY